MSSIRRILPETYDTRLEALLAAKNKLDSIAPADNPLSAATTTRLTNATTEYSNRMSNVAAKKFAYNSNTTTKDSTQAGCLMFSSHFFQVFNLGVKRNVYTAAQRDFFNLPVGSDALPDMVKAIDLLLWSGRIVDGDVERVTAGGAPMSNPTTVEVSAQRAAFLTAFNNQSNLKDELDEAQEHLEAAIDNVDKVIKKVWDELETFYNEEDDDSRRDNCREWGVVYITMGSDKTLSGTVTYNGAPGVGLVVHFKNGKNKSTCNAAGAYSLNTTLMNTQTIQIDKLDENNVVVKTWSFEVELNEDGDKTQNFAVSD